MGSAPCSALSGLEPATSKHVTFDSQEFVRCRIPYGALAIAGAMTEFKPPALFALWALVALGLAACGGGSSSPTPHPTPSGVPTPTPSPVPSAVSVPNRPLNNGDAFSYAGTTAQSFVYQGASPSPAASSLASVTQTVAVSAPSSFNGVSALYDFHTNETDTTPLQTTTIATDTYYASLTSGASSNLVDYGYSSTDNFGETLLVQYGASGAPVPIVIDELPEVPGANWSNTAAETLNETSPGNQTSVRNVNADGSYTATTTYASGSLFTPPPAPVTATIVENSNGSGSYSLPLIGPPNSIITVGTPGPGPSPQIPVTLSVPDAAPTTIPVPVWYPTPLVLYNETDTNTGAQNLPGACNVPATYGLTGNGVVQTIKSVDAILGTTETLQQTTYVVPTYGAACVVLSDQLVDYYDYSGQGPALIVVSGTPLETTTITTTLGLTSATVSSAARTRATSTAAAGFRIANARVNFIATVERVKLAHERKLLAHLSSAILERMHR